MIQMQKVLHFQASQIDRTDVSLWFSLAGVAAKLGHLHMCRGALEVKSPCLAFSLVVGPFLPKCLSV